jgi:hypothetical protein
MTDASALLPDPRLPRGRAVERPVVDSEGIEAGEVGTEAPGELAELGTTGCGRS